MNTRSHARVLRCPFPGREAIIPAIKTEPPRPTRSGPVNGFSLAEVVVAIGVSAVALLVSIGLLSQTGELSARATAGERARQVAEQLPGLLRRHPETEVARWVDQGRPLFAYEYAAATGGDRADGTPPPGIPGEDSGVTVIRSIDDPLLAADAAALLPPLLRIDLEPLGPGGPAGRPLRARLSTVSDTSGQSPAGRELLVVPLVQRP